MKPKISIIVPVYGTERYLNRCLSSIKKQSFNDFEVIIVNDCTKDNSLDIIQQYTSNDNRFILINHTYNRGSMQARQTGIMNAQGKYICFIDSDDYIPSTAISSLYHNIESTGKDIVAGNYIFEKSSKEQYPHCSSITESISGKSLIIKILEGKYQNALWGKLYKRELFSNRSFDIFENHSLGEDQMLIFQLLDQDPTVGFIPENVYYYCRNFDSTTKSKWTDRQFEQTIKTKNWLYQRYGKNTEYAHVCLAYISGIYLKLLKFGCPDKYIKRFNGELQLRIQTYIQNDYPINKKIVFYILSKSEIMRKIYTLRYQITRVLK